MPGFWIFMYRVSPFTYYVSAVLSTGVAQADITCSANELLHLSPPPGMTCGEFLGDYVELTKGKLLDYASETVCQICSASRTDQFLASVNIYYSDRWRNIGILFVYLVVNVIGAVFFYWLARVPKQSKKKVKKE